MSPYHAVTFRELELEKKRLNAQVEDITEELKVEQKEKAEYVTKTVQLESDLSTTKQSLEEKKEQGETTPHCGSTRLIIICVIHICKQ